MSHTFLEVINQANYLNCLSQRLLCEKNKHMLMKDFNADLLKCTRDTSTAQFLVQMYLSSLLPQISSPTCLQNQKL